MDHWMTTRNRKTGGVLQPVNSERINMRSAPIKSVATNGDENANVASNRRKTSSVSSCESVKTIKQRHDASTQTDVSCDNILEDTNDAQVAYQLMTTDEVSSEYWKILAERRREALADTLAENEKLHELNRQLREDNARLLELASQAEYFANMLKEVTEPEDEVATN